MLVIAQLLKNAGRSGALDRGGILQAIGLGDLFRQLSLRSPREYVSTGRKMTLTSKEVWRGGGRVVPEVFCPVCKVGQVVYNGNYFCEYLDNGCDWALSHDDRTGEPVGKRDKAVWQKIKEVLNLT